MQYSETYKLFGGLDAGSATGPFRAFVELFEGPTPISWTVTATTGNGDVVFVQEGEINDNCGDYTSNLMQIDLEEYVDNGCEDGFEVPSLESQGGGRRAFRRG